jgi:phage shock protein C
MSKKLYRSNTNRMLGGVCAGLGVYLDIDPTWIRIFFVLLVLTSGIGFPIYLILWIVMPREDRMSIQSSGGTPQPDELADRARLMGEEIREAASQRNPNLTTFLGIGLLLLGASALLDALNFHWWNWFNNAIIWPGILILAGVVLLIRAMKGE